MSIKRKSYSAAFKTKLVLKVLEESQSVNQIASSNNVTPKQLTVWKKQFLSNAEIAMEPSKAVKEYKDRIKEQSNEIESLHKSLGKVVAEKDWLSKKLKSLGSKTRKSLIDPQASIPLKNQCELLNVNRSSFYYKKKPVKAEKKEIINEINKIYEEVPFYGAIKVQRLLLERGKQVSVNTVAKYRSDMGLKVIEVKRKPNLSEPRKEHKKYPYLLRELEINDPNQVWSTDITYISLKEGTVYLAAIIDWHSKAVLAHKISNTMDASLVTGVLSDALDKYSKPQIMNTDQGSQYTGEEHTKLLDSFGIDISMDGVGRATDNIAIERFWKTAKYEDIYLNQYETLIDLKEGVRRYIDFYNYHRFHQSLDYKKPMDVYFHSNQIDLKNVA